MDWNIVLFLGVFCLTYYLLVRRGNRKMIKELEEFIERFHSSEKTGEVKE